MFPGELYRTDRGTSLYFTGFKPWNGRPPVDHVTVGIGVVMVLHHDLKHTGVTVLCNGIVGWTYSYHLYKLAENEA